MAGIKDRVEGKLRETKGAISDTNAEHVRGKGEGTKGQLEGKMASTSKKVTTSTRRKGA